MKVLKTDNWTVSASWNENHRSPPSSFFSCTGSLKTGPWLRKVCIFDFVVIPCCCLSNAARQCSSSCYTLSGLILIPPIRVVGQKCQPDKMSSRLKGHQVGLMSFDDKSYVPIYKWSIFFWRTNGSTKETGCLKKKLSFTDLSISWLDLPLRATRPWKLIFLEFFY